MTKYKKQFQTMINEYSTFFADFKTLHDKVAAGDEDLRPEFNEKGRKILRIIRKYEDALCSKTENSGFGKFSENLSELFWSEVRAYLPRIDEVELL